MSTLRFTDQDRDEHGFIRIAPLPEPEASPAVEPPPAPAFAQPLPPGARAPLAGASMSSRGSAPLSRESVIVLAGALAIVLALVGIGVGARALAPAPATPAAAPTRAATAPATLAPTAAPTTTPARELPRALVAYAAPDGEPLGAIEPGRVYTPTAQLGGAWLQLEVADSGQVWVRAGELPEVAIAELPTVTPERPTAAPDQSAPIAAPPLPAPCTADTAAYRAGWRVEVDGVPVGEVSAWSCVSQAEAEQRARAAEADLRATVTTGD